MYSCISGVSCGGLNVSSTENEKRGSYRDAKTSVLLLMHHINKKMYSPGLAKIVKGYCTESSYLKS